MRTQVATAEKVKENVKSEAKKKNRFKLICEYMKTMNETIDGPVKLV